MKKSITILGSTGSIGTQTLDIVRCHPDKFTIKALIANKNIELLSSQAKEFKPDIVGIQEESCYQDLKLKISSINHNINVITGLEEICHVASHIPVDIIVSAISGSQGLYPTFASLEQSNNTILAIANKETLVIAGELFTKKRKESAVKVIPVDSEHNAIYQILNFNNVIFHDQDHIEKIILTASGGSCLNIPIKELAFVTIQQALSHPNWQMGQKVTIDSATMMNKCLELIEARYLFSDFTRQFDVIINPQSIIHGIIAYKDGNYVSVASIPDMRIPIAYAISNEQRLLSTVDIAPDYIELHKNIKFLELDYQRFPLVKTTLELMRQDEWPYYYALNYSNEQAVKKFIEGQINFVQIYDYIMRFLNTHHNILSQYTGYPQSLEAISELQAHLSI